MLNKLPQLADYPFPVAFQTHLYVMAAHLWVRVQDMTMSDIGATGAAYFRHGPKLGLVLTPMHDLFGHIVDIETRLSNNAEAHKLRRKPSFEIPCFIAVPVFADEYSFLEAFADLVERHWLRNEIDLRMRWAGRELGALTQADLLQAREELQRLRVLETPLTSGRYLWTLLEAVYQELRTRGDQEPSSQRRMDHAMDCKPFAEAVKRETVAARAWHAGALQPNRACRCNLEPFADQNVRMLVQYRAAQADVRTNQAQRAARKELKCLSLTA